MHWIYLSPHFDDVALSCGGLVWEQAQGGAQASIWTICAGDAPEGPVSPFAEELHARWETGSQAVSTRRQEDINACARLSASYRHFHIPDCIYRYAGMGDGSRPSASATEDRLFLYTTNEEICGPLNPAESSLVKQLSADLAQVLPPEVQLVCPLAIGGHVDHRLTRLAAQALERPLWYYADYPYVLENLEEVESLRQTGWQANPFPISAAGLEAWQESVAAHRSQISTFWPNLPSMRVAIDAYHKMFAGILLWQPPRSKKRT